MKNVNFLIGSNNTINTPLETFSETACDFLNELSTEILKSSFSRIYPDVSSAAFWCRKANIQKLKEEYKDKNFRLGKGLCFHIAPSNIPINFAFSYFFSLLAGNSNIVRLPSKEFPQVDTFIEIFKKVISKYPEIEKRTAFIKYERNNDITAEYSKLADCRMIWGGDRTINLVRSMETKPRCTDITFADRYSVCMIDAEKVLKTDKNTITRLSENFYNDTYLMDQNACSSPQIIYWINDSNEAREKFWNAVYKTAKKKYTLQDAVCVDKYTKLCEDAINYSAETVPTTHFDNLLYRTEIIKLSDNLQNMRGKCGYFYEYSLKNEEEFYNIVNEKYQTITYFGIDPVEIAQNIVSQKLRGIDRIVPIGKAMDINIIWDGYNLINELSRIISI